MPTKGWFLNHKQSASPTGDTLIAPYTGTADLFFMNKPKLSDFRYFYPFAHRLQGNRKKVP